MFSLLNLKDEEKLLKCLIVLKHPTGGHRTYICNSNWKGKLVPQAN